LQPELAPRFPTVGDKLGEFRLLAEMGRGARGRVYLATQPALADRRVVLKVTPRSGREHVALARLQHTNIVPLYWAQDDRGRKLRLLCMPYLGKATLALVLRELSGIPLRRRTGQDVVMALDRLQGEEAPPTAPVAVPRRFLARASYVQTICWLGACCADALQYAHERGLVHLDLKPSNVLLALDGEPLLLDFHLAQEPLRSDRPAPEELGGTVGYMAPEQIAAVQAATEGSLPPQGVDGRADIYSLGVVLYEALGGQVPPPSAPDASRDLRQVNPAVSPGLADILDKCLAIPAGQRYANATALATDLRLHLADRPLKGVGNRSLMERWRKWRRRRPQALLRAMGSLLLIALSILGSVGIIQFGRTRYAEADQALRDGQRLQRDQRYDEAATSLQAGLNRLEAWPFARGLEQQLRAELRQVDAAKTADKRVRLRQELSRQVERLHFLLGVDHLPATALHRLESSVGALWERRFLIQEQLSPGASREVNQDLLDLALCWAEMHARLADPGQAVIAHQQALHVLEEAEELFGSTAPLEQQRQVHRRALGQSQREAPSWPRPPRTTWEFTMLGRGYLWAGRLEHALDALTHAVELEPANPWANYYLGLCAYQLKRYEGAALSFSICVGAVPDSAGCYYNRALALTALGQRDRARRDYDRALMLDASLAPAWLNRALLQYEEARYEQALADLRQSLAQGAKPALVNYNMAVVYLAQNDRAGARACVERVLLDEPKHEQALLLQQKLRSTH
jgi:serine/threonine protein kinase/Tfp pilus assembly protein PilF